jgi:hypothetical protein
MNGEQLRWPWDEFPQKSSDWRCCVDDYKKVREELRCLQVRYDDLREKMTNIQRLQVLAMNKLLEKEN